MVKEEIAVAQVGLPWPGPGGVSSGGGGGGYTGPCDVITTCTQFYGFRAATTAIANAGTQKLITVQRDSDSHVCDIIVATSGGPGNSANCLTSIGGSSSPGDNGQSMSAFCSGAVCVGVKWWEQVGAVRDLVNTTGTPLTTGTRIVFNCSGSLPCMDDAAAHDHMDYLTAFTALTQPFTMSYVGRRISGTASAGTMIGAYNGAGSGEVGWGGATGALYLYAGSLVTTGNVASENADHAVQFLFNGTSSLGNVDGTNTATLNPGSGNGPGADGIAVLGEPSTSTASGNCTCRIFEALVASGDQSAHFSAMHSNQSAYYGTP